MSKLLELDNIKCKDYCSLKGYKYRIIEEEKPQKIYIPNYNHKSIGSKYVESVFPEKYVAELENVNIIGKNSVIFEEDKYCISDIAVRESEEKFLYNLWGSAAEIEKANTKINYIYSGVDIPEGIMLTSNASSNYYHFNLEVISKLLLINEIPEYNNMPIIIDVGVYSIPQFVEEIEKANKLNREVIKVIPGYGYRVKKLIYISDLAIIPMSIKANCEFEYKDLSISDMAIKIIRDNLAIKKNNLYRKIYLSRGREAAKRILNSASIENIFEKYGYEIINTGTMSFEEQLQVFSEASVVAGVSGAGLTNMLFANKNTRCICIIPKEIRLTCYSTIVGQIEQPYYFLDASINDTSNTWESHQRLFNLNEEYLTKFLDNFEMGDSK